MSESKVQQSVRMSIARAGGMSWRNNVGATPHECPSCGAKQRPVRYGLCNDSAALNRSVKSSDLIGVVPRIITAEDIGTVIGQFLAIECKHEGWRYTGTEHEQAQKRWLDMIAALGGRAEWGTGEIEL